MTLSEKITYCRRRNGLCRKRSRKKPGVSRQAVSKWEMGEAQPELTKLRQLSEVFGVSADWLLNEEEPHETPRTVAPAATDSWAEKLPGFLGKLFRRYGWIAGAYTVFAGFIISLAGVLAIALSNGLLNSARQSAEQFGFGDFARPSIRQRSSAL